MCQNDVICVVCCVCAKFKLIRARQTLNAAGRKQQVTKIKVLIEVLMR